MVTETRYAELLAKLGGRQINASQALSGTLTQAWTSNAVSGQANVVGTISTAAR